MLTVAYLTSRLNPRLQWVLDGIKNQAQGRQFELIVVDYHADKEGRKEFISHGRDLPFLHVTPKPSALQGKHKQTSKDYFAAANARNTAACYAKGTHICYLDDLTCIGPEWFDNVWHCAQSQYVMCGSYKKVKDMVVENGVLISHTEFPQGVDSRWSMGSDNGLVHCSGGQLFGCSFCLPLSWYLSVGGQDEIYDGLGAEDYSLGLNLEKAGYPIYYNRNALTYESEEAHYEDEAMIRLDKRMGNTYSSNVLLEQLQASPTPRIHGNDYPIDELRALCQAGKPFPLPVKNKKDWRDGQPYKEM